ncbi:MAG: lytic transglycosylase domain-containing protein [Pseudorhodobacter sp.]|nr:lytic transglycosylase domain-containing protein [Pseudorhodobacter sp.]
MTRYPRRAALVLIFSAIAACGRKGAPQSAEDHSPTPLYPNETPELRRQIKDYARQYDVPVDLVQRVIKRESSHIPGARNGPYYGLMQIALPTARTMGYTGSAQGLLAADTNLKYGVKYLRGAWLLADGSYDQAVKWYSSGYYYEAKRRGMLIETGLRG